ncbi:peptidyl-prolyl cis-trans isomerase E-like [Manis javanica]|uniref:peptidyl-prolyl cis-trans isomerase E-like n=1 Tax=Manis javanica TaxID=9974 RepID=UPI003C6D78F2
MLLLFLLETSWILRFHWIMKRTESELFGWIIRVRLAKPVRIKESSSRPDGDWLKKFSSRTLGETKEEEGLEPSKVEAQEGTPSAKKARSNPQVYMDVRIGNKPDGHNHIPLHSSAFPGPQACSPWPTLDQTPMAPSSS